MTSAKYDRKNCTLEVRGHAGNNVPGEDVVCAAASALAFTAVACAQDNSEKYIPSIAVYGDTVRIACSPLKSYVTPCRRMLETVFTGFELLAESYPDNVRTERED